MNLKKVPLKAISVITLSGLFLIACDDSRVRISADSSYGYSGPRHHGHYHSGYHGHSGHHHGGYLTHTPHKHRVSFDAALGMYVVLGLMNTYWNNGHYYRYDNHVWHRSSDYRRWRRMQRNRIPYKLYRRHHRTATYNNWLRHRDKGRVAIIPRDRTRHNDYRWMRKKQ